jgi:hypothetical protein
LLQHPSTYSLLNGILNVPSDKDSKRAVLQPFYGRSVRKILN